MDNIGAAHGVLRTGHWDPLWDALSHKVGQYRRIKLDQATGRFRHRTRLGRTIIGPIERVYRTVRTT